MQEGHCWWCLGSVDHCRCYRSIVSIGERATLPYLEAIVLTSHPFSAFLSFRTIRRLREVTEA